MKICIVAEGSYPYITGGVSSWIHQLISNLPEYEFILITLMPDNKKKGKYVYSLPNNLINIKELFLEDLLNTKGKWNKKFNLSENGIKQVSNLLSFKEVGWDKLFAEFQNEDIKKLTGADIQKSKVFYDEIQNAYINNYTFIPFTNVYWTFKSMYIVLFQILLEEYPYADIYHSVSTGYAGIIGAFAANSNNKAFILTEHGIYTREREEEIIKAQWVKGYLKDMWVKYFYQLSNCAYMSADKVVALFESNREIQIEIGCPMEKTEVIPNGIDTKDFKDVALEVINRNDIDHINIGSVVRIVPIKDIITMLEAFNIVNKKIKNINFYIMGPTEEEPDYYDECMRIRNTLGLFNVSFLGKVDIKEHFKKMDILVLTSISEGQPLVILEGLACKLPFVSTDVGDCSSLIIGEGSKDEIAGRLSKVMDAESIALNIIELCNNPKLRREYGENGYKRVEKYYRFDIFINKYRDIYNEYGLRD